MNITRHNYEEFFMLYADNELSPEQRGEVEVFVGVNPDLKSELDLFLSLKMEEDPAVNLGDKSFLFRKETAVQEEVQTQMLLHLDGELPAAEAASLEARISGDQSLRQEWEILNRVKLLPELEIRFPDRQLLYRRAAAGARVLHIRWVRYAAAAVAVLIAGLLWLNNPEQNDTQAGSVTLAAADSGNRQQTADSPGETLNETAGNTNDEPAPALASPETIAPESQLAAVPNTKRAGNQQEAARVKVQENSDHQQTRESIPVARSIAESAPVEKAGEVALTTVKVSPKAGQVLRDVTDKPVGMEGVKTDYATQALTMQVQGQEEFTEVVYRENDKERKGFRGLVRKANRIFNKVTNPDLDKTVVKVANVEIGLGR